MLLLLLGSRVESSRVECEREWRRRARGEASRRRFFHSSGEALFSALLAVEHSPESLCTPATPPISPAVGKSAARLSLARLGLAGEWSCGYTTQTSIDNVLKRVRHHLSPDATRGVLDSPLALPPRRSPCVFPSQLRQMLLLRSKHAVVPLRAIRGGLIQRRHVQHAGRECQMQGNGAVAAHSFARG